MGHYYQFSYALEEGLALIPGLLSMVSSGAFHIAAYVLTAVALYTMAKRRGIKHGWLSWIPVANVWVLGSLSDQYRYVVKGAYKSKRKWLLILKIISTVLGSILTVVSIAVTGEVIGGLMYGMDMEYVLDGLVVPGIGIALLSLPMAGVAIAGAIGRYMALYDIYTSCDPQNNVLFLVLSVLFGVTEPFFLFFNRNKEDGMPPRRQEPQYIPLENTETYDV